MVTSSLLKWRGTIGYLILAAALTFAIASNQNDIDKVCTTVQRQLDRNAATLERSLAGQELIRSKPREALRRKVPGATYYIEHPDELRASIDRTKDELATYQVNAC